ncbi:MAG TPA: Gfo/Idh/MocA family oxidoreductase [Bryobacterales bacterium]|nr:Gfo/Idh/MocA family oxidoreductase [Bryobacterales bacterium]
MADDVNRRDFVKRTVGVGAALGVGKSLLARSARPAAQGRVIGANDRINIGCIGVGGRGTGVMKQVLRMGEADGKTQVVAVCDVYEKRKRHAQQLSKAELATLDYREVLARKDVDAVIIATPDHWHARIALDAMDAGKDVYLEKPMTHTIEEAKQVWQTTVETKRVLQVGSQTTSSDQWWKARKAIQDGMVGQMIMSQGSYHRNSKEGEWNYPIDAGAGPDGKGENYVDWKTWLGSAPKRPWDADRFFRFRKYWDYSGGIATDLFYHVVAPLQICWGEPQFPARVAATGGIWVFKDREVPDTFMLTADFAKGHSLVLSSSMANSTHIPGLIRGHEGTIMMVEHGMFEGHTDHITVTAEGKFRDEFVKKFGSEKVVIPVEDKGPNAHMQNFLDCVRSREKPVLDALTAYKAMVTIGLSVESYRKGKMMYFDEEKQKASDKPPKGVSA